MLKGVGRHAHLDLVRGLTGNAARPGRQHVLWNRRGE
jgi:hypothetical protein